MVALGEDPWFGRWHWLPSRTESDDHVYSVADSPYQLTMQGLVV